jgi:DNA-binding transcriptional regulator YdaS (Cro superfamily)
MKLHEWTAMKRGRAARLARFLGVEPPVVSDWCTEVKQVPLERCVPVEQFTGREVTCEEMRPDKAADFAYLRGQESPCEAVNV